MLDLSGGAVAEGCMNAYECQEYQSRYFVLQINLCRNMLHANVYCSVQTFKC